jgi:cation:H+ antiporter
VVGDVLLLAASFAVILVGALTFTNAVEWMGHKLSLGEGAVGSLLAAVGTAMPESLIPLVAILGGSEGSEDVAIGAIVGAPFLLATIAMFLVGVSALAYQRRRPTGHRLDIHAQTVERDLGVFLVFFAIGLVLGAVDVPDTVKIAGAVALLAGYAGYVTATLRGGGEMQSEDTLEPLVLHRVPLIMDSTPRDDPPTRLVVIQFLVGLGAMVGGAHLFVEEVITVAESLGAEVLILSLVLAPLATELPEKANSFFWVREGKDTLALGNITGAMVFQSMIPVAFGLAFTEWDLDRYGIASMALGLAGGLVALVVLARRREFTLPAILLWGALYLAFLGIVIFA